jgi:hypothetical protein
VLLVIEVADTSLAFDREEKIPLYAAASILEVWLVDLVGKQLVTYRRPTHGNYAETARHRAGALVPVLCLPDSSVAVSELASEPWQWCCIGRVLRCLFALFRHLSRMSFGTIERALRRRAAFAIVDGRPIPPNGKGSLIFNTSWA